MKGIFFIGLLFLLTTCTVVPEQEVNADSNTKIDDAIQTPMITALQSDSLAKDSARAFEALLTKAVKEKLISPEDRESRELLQSFFPNTSRYPDYQVSIEPIALRDSFWLLLYEFVTEGTEKNQMFLGSFRKTGQVVDLLEIQAISYDGHVSLSLLEDDVMEIAYRDFAIQQDPPGIGSHDEFKTPVDLTKKSFRQFINVENQMETSDSEYYRVLPNGLFEHLMKTLDPDITRVFPQASFRVLTNDELEELQEGDRQLMRNEIYASHGYRFQEESITTYFQDKGWYEPDSCFTPDQLKGVEKVNLDKLLRLEEK